MTIKEPTLQEVETALKQLEQIKKILQMNEQVKGT